MTLLWSLIAAAALCMAIAGVQAVRLLASRDGDVARLSLRISALEAEADSTARQIEAQKVLLGHAQAWMKAQINPAGERAQLSPAGTP